MSARRSEPARGRERILVEAARLFARRGYHATTTRQIAQAVGIRQPSLFHHFPSKHAIVQEILRSDLDEAVPAAEVLASGPGPASVRLYRYLRHDVEHLVGSPYDLPAPRGAPSYSRHSREELGRRFLGLMANLASKD